MSILKEMEKRGSYAQLSSGKVRYELVGPENGELVVLVHGFMGHMHVWDKNVQFLVDSGYRVLCFDLYGRGFSERVRLNYDAKLFVGQLLDMVNHVSKGDRFHLIGSSMGGAISTRFASEYPDLVKSIMLVDPYGIPQPKDLGIRIVQPKLFGEVFIGTLGSPILNRAPIKGIFNKKKYSHFTKWFAAPLVIKRSKRALLSTLRHFMLENHVPHYQRLNDLDIPKLLLWGREDKVLTFAYGERIHSLLPTARFEVFELCGHVPHYEEPEKFNALTLQFLKEQV